MIKLDRSPCPEELTEEVRQKLTQVFKDTGKSVWKAPHAPYIEEPLLKSSHNKCAYCEGDVTTGSSFMEVEHFHDKSTHPDEVVKWENLLPSCKRCNGKKHTFNTKLEPFINPYEINPKEHLVFSDYTLFPKTIAGRNTINELLLNDPQRLHTVRYKIGKELTKQIEDLHEKVCDYKNGVKPSSRTRNSIISTLENLMVEALPTSTYSATVATVMTNNAYFLTIVDILKQLDLWSPDMDNMFYEIKKNSLDTDISEAVNFLQSI